VRILRTTSTKSTPFFSPTTRSRFKLLKSSTRSSRVDLLSWETCQLFLAPSLGHVTCSIASQCQWNNSHQSSLSSVTINAQSSNTTRSATLYFPMSTSGARSGSLKLRRRRLVFRQPWLSAILITTSCMWTSTLKFSLWSVRQNACPVSELTFLSQQRLFCSRKRSSSTTTTSFSSFCVSMTALSTRSDQTQNHYLFPTWKILSTSCALVWLLWPGPQWTSMVTLTTYTWALPSSSNLL
jgi:hypothetical protein